MFRFSRKNCWLHIAAAFLILLLSETGPVVYGYDLNLINNGAGRGDVNGTVVCTLGPYEGCYNTLANGTQVSLAANGDWKSVFDGWGPPCSGTGSCSFELNENTELAANFSQNLQATIVAVHDPRQYTNLTEAYADAFSGCTIAAHVYTFYENLTFDRPVSFTLFGGREGVEYLSHEGYTTLAGTLDVQQGSVYVDGMIVSSFVVQQYGSVEISSLIVQ